MYFSEFTTSKNVLHSTSIFRIVILPERDGGGGVLPFKSKKLSPGTNGNKLSGIARNAVHRNVLVILWRIGAHFQVKDNTCSVHLAVSKDNIAVVDGLAAARQRAVTESVGVIFYYDVVVSAVVRVFVRNGSLPPFNAIASSFTDM